MSGIKTYQTYYFIGIGGIGMSALARYYKSRGAQVLGYDKTPTLLTRKLENEGVEVHYNEDVDLLANLSPECTLVIYTPAVPEEHAELCYAFKNEFDVIKRSMALGNITQELNCIAVAGTHGKTTTSCMVGHILTEAGKAPNAFLGGISSNYDTNLLLGKSDDVVVEADEYDRSFLTLSPNTAIVTSMDADHLDIYRDGNDLEASFVEFMSLVPMTGSVILRYGLPVPPNTMVYTYGYDQNADLSAQNVRIENGYYVCDFYGAIEMPDVIMGMPGKHNLENALAASLAAFLNGVQPEDIKRALRTFTGVKRRFEYCIRNEKLVYIDDYAHHPTELEACIQSVKQLYPSQKITGIFQPHLFSRTRDFADDFARSLELLDTLFLLDIYPAREEPIDGVTSAWLLDKVQLNSKKVCSKEDAVNEILALNPEILLTLGAGDIDQLVEPLKAQLA